jgi:hypothetical protein
MSKMQNPGLKHLFLLNLFNNSYLIKTNFMNNELKDLIRLSTINGHIDQNAKQLIYLKAKELGVSQSEVDIYINGYIHEGQSKTVSNKSYVIWGLVTAVVITIIYLMYSSYETDRLYDKAVKDVERMQNEAERDIQRQMDQYDNY